MIFSKVYSILHGVLRITLTSYKMVHGSSRNLQEVNVNQKLIDKCFADAAEETLESKVTK